MTEVQDRDKGFQAMIDGLARQHGELVKVGWRDEMAEIAVVHEFGWLAMNIPERGPLRKTLENPAVLAEIERLALMHFDKPRAFVQKVIGEYVVGAVRQTMADGLEPANTEETRKRKSKPGMPPVTEATDRPLIDEGTLLKKVEHW